MRRLVKTLTLACLLAASTALAGDWYQWRGPEQSGVSREKNLPSTWDPDTGENVLWKAPAGGMSSPIVMKNKVYTWTRRGEVKSGDETIPTLLAGPQTQEAFVCLDANTGKQIWEHKENMTQTDVPFHRLGWGNPVGDPKTNRVYGMGSQCRLLCMDADTGKLLWSRHMTEEFGMISTFGGRTPSPALDGDILYIGGVSFGWGDQAQGQHRLFAFDKNTGDLLWSAGTGGRPVDAPYNTPVVTNIAGQRVVMLAAGDGGVHAYQARTGKPLWSYAASKRGLNASVVVDGERVFVSHSEENLDNHVMGRVVCLDVSGENPREVWRKDGIEAGFASPTLGNGNLYVIDNSGMVHALDVSDGSLQWKKRVDTIGKASLTFGDNKLFAAGGNGKFVILQGDGKKVNVVSKKELTDKLGREYNIFGSVAISDGRIFLQAANEMFCIADKNRQPVPDDAQIALAPEEEMPAHPAPPAPKWIQVVPADVVLRAGETIKLKAFGFDEKGRPLGPVKGDWSIGQVMIPAPPSAPKGTPGTLAGNLKGTVKPNADPHTATFSPDTSALSAGAVNITIGDVKGFARVRVMPDLPWSIDFKNAPVNKPPLTWIGVGGKFAIREVDGMNALTKLTDFDLYHAARTYLGSTHMSNYTIQADIKVGEKMLGESHQVPDAGVINTKYALVLLGNHQRLQINVWAGALPTEQSWSGSLNKTISYKWTPNKWYRMKLRVDPPAASRGVAKIAGKVWPKNEEEPKNWTIQLEDPMPNTEGSPGLFGESLITPMKSEIYYTNIEVSANK